METADLISTYKQLEAAKNAIRKELEDRLSWEELLEAGLKVEAIIKYKDLYKTSVADAKKFIDSFPRKDMTLGSLLQRKLNSL